MDTDWKYLIIFDACRYDYFKEYYRIYFDGNLKLLRSNAIYTLEWLMKNFPGNYPIRYISTVPFCNSRVPARYGNDYYDAKKHFKKIYDLWDFAWDGEKETVFPEAVTEFAAMKTVEHPEDKFIIHYMQPHEPYLSINDGVNGKWNKVRGNLGKLQSNENKAKMMVVSAVMRTLGLEFMWKINKLMGKEPVNRMEAAWRVAGSDGLRRAYTHNLIRVMAEASRLIDNLPEGDVVITSDHGELLGEKGYWGHGRPRPRLPELIEVPWLEVRR